MIRQGVPRRIATVMVAVLFASPGVVVLWRAASLGDSAAEAFAELAGPAWRTIQLAVLVSVSCAVVGTVLAWLVTATDLPGRRWWRIALILPIALPSFVGVTAILAGFTPGGVLHALWEAVGLEPPKRIRGLVPSWLLLTTYSYPFVLLPVSARLATLRPSLAESARLLGSSPWSTFVRVTLPQVRGAVTGGALIVALYVLSEFGAVQLLGYDTLTRVIYATRQVDRPRSFMAAAMVLVLSVVVVIIVRRSGGGRTVDDRTTGPRTAPIALRAWTVPALVTCGGVLAVGVAAPLSSLVAWAAAGVRDGRIDLSALTGPAANTVVVGVITAVVAVLAVLPVAIGSVRHRDPVSAVAAVTVVGGFALPAIVIALAFAVVTLNVPILGGLYQTLPVLVVAYVVHFGSQALVAVEQSARTVSRPLLDSGRLLEPVWWRRAVRIEMPLMRPGLVAGGGLVLLATFKELPATLLLSPIGFRTLATEVWASFEEGFLAQASVAAIVLLVVSGALTWLLVLRHEIAAVNQGERA